MMAEANSVDTESSENNDVSSQLSEIRENYEKKVSDMQSEFSQLRDLMMAVLQKSDNENQNTSTQGPSMQPRWGLALGFSSNFRKPE